jgi:hypothetical protein
MLAESILYYLSVFGIASLLVVAILLLFLRNTKLSGPGGGAAVFSPSTSSSSSSSSCLNTLGVGARPLGLLEQRLVLEHEAGAFMNFALVIQCKTMLGRVPTPASLGATMRTLTRQHPSLRARIITRETHNNSISKDADTDTETDTDTDTDTDICDKIPHEYQYVFTQLHGLESSEDFSKHIEVVQRCQPHTWQQTVQRIHAQPFDIDCPETPLWRIVVVAPPPSTSNAGTPRIRLTETLSDTDIRTMKMDDAPAPGTHDEFELILVMHPAIADGVSAAQLCSELLVQHAVEFSQAPQSHSSLSLHSAAVSDSDDIKDFEFDNDDGADADDTDVGAGAGAGVGADELSTSTHRAVNSQVVDTLPVDVATDIRPTFQNVALSKLSLLGVALPRRFTWSMRHVWLGKRHNEALELSSSIRFLQLTPEQTDDLVHACRSHSTSVHGALVSAATFALAAVLDKPRTFLCRHSVSLRPYCNDEAADRPLLGARLCNIDSMHRMRPYTEFWAEAVATVNQLHGNAAAAPSKIGLLRYGAQSPSALAAELAERRPNGRTCTIGVANLGRLMFDRFYGDWQLKGLYFSQTKTYDGPIFMISVATAADRLCASISGVPQLLPHESATEHFVREWKRVLLLAIERPTFTLGDYVLCQSEKAGKEDTKCSESHSDHKNDAAKKYK